MAIMGFIIVVAGRAFSDSTGMRIRSQNMLQSAEEAGRVSALLKEDISQMGAKSWGTSSTSGMNFEKAAGVFWSSTDSSSYELKKGQNYDTITFRKVHYDASGRCGDVLEIKWFVDANSTLSRTCERQNKCTGGTFNANRDCPASVEMARNVAEFKFLPSVPGPEGSSSTSATLYPYSGSTFGFLAKTSASASSTAIAGGILSGFSRNSSSSGTLHTNYYLRDGNTNNCRQFTFHKNEEYAISFELLYIVTATDPCKSTCQSGNKANRYNPISMFQAGRDHLSAGLRNSSMSGEPMAGVPDFLFYPPQDAVADEISTRLFTFSVPQTTTACVGITAAFYSPASKGHLDISNFQIYRKTDNVYHFDRSSGSTYNPSSASAKAQVKAFELTLGINKKGEINRTVTVIPVPNNGVGGN